ncbi:MAG: type II secretion system secretin GspD [Desulfuromonadales bacterium]|nr:type II secretion system secretin GspD [Desulfuromonadales bacterium]
MENKRYFPAKLLVLWLVILLFCVPGRIIATAAEEMLITLDFQNVELVDMISTISELTGKNFLYDETVRGKVSILSPQPVSLDEAYRLFLTVLRVRGFTVVPAGQVNKIVTLASAKEETLPFTAQRGLGDQHVTRILELRQLDATVAVETILRPLMPKTSHVVAHQATNTIVITDTAQNIERLNRLLNTLDKSWDRESVELLPLQYAEAADTAALAMQILEGGGGAAPATRAARQAQSGGKRVAGQIIPYERTNTLAVQGEPAFIAQAKKLIAQLDVDVTTSFSGVHVYYLEHAEAVPLAETINQIVAGAARTPSVPRTAEGQPTAVLFKDVKVTADKPTNSLIINASQDELRNVMALIGQLDIKRKQVFVEALIMDLSMRAVLELGTSLQGAVDLGSDSIISASTGGMPLGGPNIIPSGDDPGVLKRAVEGILLGGLFNPISYSVGGVDFTVPAVSALINLSESDSDVNILSAPRLLTSDNEEAEIIVGENVPIITSRATASGGGDNIISAVERQDAALILRFTPQITAGGLVRMKIHQEISGVKQEGGVGDENDIGPTLTKTLLRNSIVARDGETVVLGGLFRNQVTKTVSKVPLLGDIPILGWLFKSTTDRDEKRSLLIFITPRVIADTEDLSRLTTDTHRDLQLFRSEGGTQEFFEQQRMKTIGDFAVPLEN